MFRDWPYLYDGSPAYEEKYLAKLAAADGAVIVAAYDGAAIVGWRAQPGAVALAQHVEVVALT